MQTGEGAAAGARPGSCSVGIEGVETPKQVGQAFDRCVVHAGIKAPGRPVAVCVEHANCVFRVEIANPECSRERAR
jgi:hypothetical protein